VDLSVDSSVSEKHAVYIFRAEVAMLGSGGIWLLLDEGKAEGVGQSGTRSEVEAVSDRYGACDALQRIACLHPS
jgi:hypothetical protein